MTIPYQYHAKPAAVPFLRTLSKVPQHHCVTMVFDMSETFAPQQHPEETPEQLKVLPRAYYNLRVLKCHFPELETPLSRKLLADFDQIADESDQEFAKKFFDWEGPAEYIQFPAPGYMGEFTGSRVMYLHEEKNGEETEVEAVRFGIHLPHMEPGLKGSESSSHFHLTQHLETGEVLANIRLTPQELDQVEIRSLPLTPFEQQETAG